MVSIQIRRMGSLSICRNARPTGVATPLPFIQEYRKLHIMRTTLNIPDELYRRVKARSAMEGRPVRSVAVELFQQWLDGPAEEALPTPEETSDKKFPWLAITRRYVRPGMSHDLDEMRAAIARGWGAS